jgi:hypothetical protein
MTEGSEEKPDENQGRGPRRGKSWHDLSSHWHEFSFWRSGSPAGRSAQQCGHLIIMAGKYYVHIAFG